ncbi:MAG: GNAT family N-acetyltransferase [Candidatus Falkowbacteria bacterium]|nr:MAG: GNAT family N-acetyltransferase [Candidatus Falkowbacteria bacterium]
MSNIKTKLNTDIKIRRGTQADLRFVCDLSRRNMEEYTKEIWGGWDGSRFKANLNLKRLKMIIKNNRRAGFFDVENRGQESYLHNIQLSRPLHGKGLGKILMEKIEAAEKKAGTKRMIASVFNNNPAKEFYKKIGYQIIKREKGILIIGKDL